MYSRDGPRLSRPADDDPVSPVEGQEAVEVTMDSGDLLEEVVEEYMDRPSTQLAVGSQQAEQTREPSVDLLLEEDGPAGEGKDVIMS